MNNMVDRQQRYEHTRRSRTLGLSIDQSVQGIKNIIVYSNPKLWEVDDPGLIDVQKWLAIREHAERLLVDLSSLEKKLASMVPIYATLIPSNPEATLHADPTTDKD
jgi:hypothetical protein